MIHRKLFFCLLLEQQASVLAKPAVETVSCSKEAANGKYCNEWRKKYVYIGMAAAGGGCGKEDCDKVGSAECSCTQALASGAACADYTCNEQGYPGSAEASVETITCVEESTTHCRRWNIKYNYVGMAAAGGGCGRSDCDKVGTATCVCTNTTKSFYSCGGNSCTQKGYPGSATDSTESIMCLQRSSVAFSSRCTRWSKRMTYTGMAAAGGGCDRKDCGKQGTATCDCTRTLANGLGCADYKCQKTGYGLTANASLPLGSALFAVFAFVVNAVLALEQL